MRSFDRWRMYLCSLNYILDESIIWQWAFVWIKCLVIIRPPDRSTKHINLVMTSFSDSINRVRCHLLKSINLSVSSAVTNPVLIDFASTLPVGLQIPQPRSIANLSSKLKCMSLLACVLESHELFCPNSFAWHFQTPILNYDYQLPSPIRCILWGEIQLLFLLCITWYSPSEVIGETDHHYSSL